MTQLILIILKDLKELLKKLASEEKMTILISSHLLSELESFLKSKGIATNEAYLFDFSQCTIPLRDYDISQLFAQFRVIVRGLELEELE